MTWQTGLRSNPTNRKPHEALRNDEPGHRITIPAHDNLKVGTLDGILKDVAAQLGTTRDQVVRNLW
ncbi:MAG: hypothetical protein ACOC9B_05430 [Chloroflexota bacterium]